MLFGICMIHLPCSCAIFKYYQFLYVYIFTYKLPYFYINDQYLVFISKIYNKCINNVIDVEVMVPFFMICKIYEVLFYFRYLYLLFIKHF